MNNFLEKVKKKTLSTIYGHSLKYRSWYQNIYGNNFYFYLIYINLVPNQTWLN